MRNLKLVDFSPSEDMCAASEATPVHGQDQAVCSRSGAMVMNSEIFSRFLEGIQCSSYPSLLLKKSEADNRVH